MPTISQYNPQQQGMGIGPVGIGDPEVVFKRKFRWTLEIIGGGNCPFRIPPYFVKIAARPNISFEETELNFLNDKTWIPGKATWESITVTYMDVAGNLSGDAAGGNLALYDWLTNVFDFTSPTRKFMNSKRSTYTGTAELTLWDGCGSRLEVWRLLDAWPQAINFGDLDYSSSDTVDIELTMRYSQVSFEHLCPAHTYNPCCVPCNQPSSSGNVGVAASIGGAAGGAFGI
jgi:hypothetical protein